MLTAAGLALLEDARAVLLKVDFMKARARGLGEGVETHLRQLAGASAPQPIIEADAYAPALVHPLPSIDWSTQIERKGDLRQMETWQKLGTYTAGLALDDAAIPEDEAFRSTIDMIVAAGGGQQAPAQPVADHEEGAGAWRQRLPAGVVGHRPISRSR